MQTINLNEFALLDSLTDSLTDEGGGGSLAIYITLLYIARKKKTERMETPFKVRAPDDDLLANRR